MINFLLLYIAIIINIKCLIFMVQENFDRIREDNKEINKDINQFL